MRAVVAMRAVVVACRAAMRAVVACRAAMRAVVASGGVGCGGGGAEVLSWRLRRPLHARQVLSRKQWSRRWTSAVEEMMGCFRCFVFVLSCCRPSDGVREKWRAPRVQQKGVVAAMHRRSPHLHCHMSPCSLHLQKRMPKLP